MADLGTLPTVWLVLVGAFWALYLVLGGADLGVAMLLRRLGGGTEAARGAVLRATGPTWQANDVWLVIAVASMFGAFPGWYGAWASGLYLPLLVILLALIVRHAGIELLGHLSPRAQHRWTHAIVASAWVTAFGFGVAWAAALDGSLAAGKRDGLGVLSPATVLAGLALVALCRAGGAAFLAGRLEGALQAEAREELRRAAPVAALLTTGAAVALGLGAAPGVAPGTAGWALLALAGAALAGLTAAGLRGRPRTALWAGGLAVAALLAALLTALAPGVIAGPGGVDLRVEASGSYTLALMTAVAAVFVPLALAAQVFAYGRFARHPGETGRDSVVARVARRGMAGLR